MTVITVISAAVITSILFAFKRHWYSLLHWSPRSGRQKKKKGGMGVGVWGGGVGGGSLQIKSMKPFEETCSIDAGESLEELARSCRKWKTG